MILLVLALKVLKKIEIVGHSILHPSAAALSQTDLVVSRREDPSSGIIGAVTQAPASTIHKGLNTYRVAGTCSVRHPHLTDKKIEAQRG